MTVSSQVKQTLATLKGAQSTLKIYATQTQNEETKLVYEEAVEKTADIIRDLEKRVQILEFQEPQYKGF
ncbi:MAG: hypothetical protein PWP27_2476 [Clostridiales bacterium]|nr:hypothetical protein [Clostridiales bacterium]MDK2934666.1 hypothetical protein [Clostridiales bacterium]